MMSAVRMDAAASEKILLAPSSGLWGDLAVLWLALARVAVAAGMGATTWLAASVSGRLRQWSFA